MSKIIDDERVKLILQSIEGLEYGSVSITIHDSQITQIERVERQRFHLEKSNIGQGHLNRKKLK